LAGSVRFGTLNLVFSHSCLVPRGAYLALFIAFPFPISLFILCFPLPLYPLSNPSSIPPSISHRGSPTFPMGGPCNRFLPPSLSYLLFSFNTFLKFILRAHIVFTWVANCRFASSFCAFGLLPFCLSGLSFFSLFFFLRGVDYTYI